MKKFLITAWFLLLGATSVKETVTEQSIWDQILAEQARAQIYRGSKALYFNSYQNAVRLLTKAVHSNPNDPIAHRQLGVALYWTGAVEEAVASYQRSLALDPRDENTYLVLGIAYAWLGDIDTALEQFSKTLELNPRRSDAHMNLGSVWDAKGEHDKSAYHFTQALILEPDNALYHFQLGSLHAKYLNYSSAIKSLYKAQRLAPYFEDTYVELGAVYRAVHNIKEAEFVLKKAVNLKPGDLAAKLILASLYRKEGLIDKTETLFRECLAITPGGNAGRLSLAIAFRGEKDTPSSAPLEQFKKNLERIPEDESAIVTVETVYERQIEISTSVHGVEAERKPSKMHAEGFKKMIELVPSNKDNRSAQIEDFMDSIEQSIAGIPDKENIRLTMDIKHDTSPSLTPRKKKKHNEKPKAVYQPRSIGNDAGLWIMGTAWMRLIDHILDQNLESGDHDRLSMLEKGIAHLQIGQADRAVETFKTLIDRNPNDALAWNGAAVGYLELGDIEQAMSCYQQILNIEPKNRIALESLNYLREEQ